MGGFKKVAIEISTFKEVQIGHFRELSPSFLHIMLVLRNRFFKVALENVGVEGFSKCERMTTTENRKWYKLLLQSRQIG